MRRKSDRTNKKTKSLPEEKVEKPKAKRTSRRRKQSSSSDNESKGEGSPIHETKVIEQIEKKSPIKQPVKDDSPEDKQDQVWQVKTSESSGDSGEIQKLKICLARPPSTSETIDKSPRSKRKHTRTTSSSDTPTENLEEKKKSKHRSKKNARESKDDSDKNQDSQGDEIDKEQLDDVSQSEEGKENPPKSNIESVSIDDIPVSTTDESQLEEITTNMCEIKKNETVTESVDKDTIADTTVDSSITDSQDSQTEIIISEQENKQCSSPVTATVTIDVNEKHEIEIENNEETSDIVGSQKLDSENDVSGNVNENKSLEEIEGEKVVKEDSIKTTDSECNYNEVTRQTSTDIDEEKKDDETVNNSEYVSSKEESTENGPSEPFVINRKRKWGSRPGKISTQKSITISTDVLKDIIPDVKPVEFDEVMEQKKHKEVEKVHRPILPKIVIDNTAHLDYPKREEEVSVTDKEPLPLSNRKVSIVKDDIVLKPLSPPRHKSSCILHITNLVRPFTLPQLKNLLQRTGRIVEDGFWIDRIKSKCYVKYETEE